MQNLLAEFLDRGELMRKYSLGGIIALVVFALGLLPPAAEAQYVGAGRCKACHLPQFKSWEQTRMAKAFELLKPGVAAEAKRSHNLDPNKDYTADPNCIACHVTGHGQPGGFVNLGKTPTMVGVQCEVCHGRGGGYLKPQLMSLQNKEYKRSDLLAVGMVVPTEETCKTCHNKKSPFFKPFDFQKRMQEGVHGHQPLKYKHD